MRTFYFNALLAVGASYAGVAAAGGSAVNPNNTLFVNGVNTPAFADISANHQHEFDATLLDFRFGVQVVRTEYVSGSIGYGAAGSQSVSTSKGRKLYYDGPTADVMLFPSSPLSVNYAYFNHTGSVKEPKDDHDTRRGTSLRGHEHRLYLVFKLIPGLQLFTGVGYQDMQARTYTETRDSNEHWHRQTSEQGYQPETYRSVLLGLRGSSL